MNKDKNTITRDEIAVADLHRLLAGYQGPDDSWQVERAVIKAYRYADALIAESNPDIKMARMEELESLYRDRDRESVRELLRYPGIARMLRRYCRDVDDIQARWDARKLSRSLERNLEAGKQETKRERL